MTDCRAFVACAVLSVGITQAQEPGITIGPAKSIVSSLYERQGGRPTAVGRSTATDGTEWTVPAHTQFETAKRASDLYNECNNITPTGTRALDLATIPVIDAGGNEQFNAYLFGDNYFEIYANGQLLAVGAVPFTPFNSSVVRFTATRPLTLAVKTVDWEENLGLGSEKGRGATYSPGDGGLTMLVTDAKGEAVLLEAVLLTDENWRTQTYYIGLIADSTCLDLSGHVRESSNCELLRSDDGTGYMAAHWSLPEGWTAPDFDDASWPEATRGVHLCYVTFSDFAACIW